MGSRLHPTEVIPTNGAAVHLGERPVVATRIHYVDGEFELLPQCTWEDRRLTFPKNAVHPPVGPIYATVVVKDIPTEKYLARKPSEFWPYHQKRRNTIT